MSNLAPAIEAILFSSNRPLRVRELQHVTDCDRAAVEQALDELRESLTHRGVMLQRHHDQIQLVTRPELAGYVRRALRPEVTGRLSPAAYETLAIVAYQQPVTRARIEEIRGVNSDGVVSNLELRDLVREVGRGTGPGQPKLYGTTIRFLQMLGLESLDDLPFPDTEDRHEAARDAAAVETERAEAVETEHPEAVETEHPEAVETEHPEAVETEHSEAVEAEHPEAVETESTEEVEADRTDAVEPEAAEAGPAHAPPPRGAASPSA